MTIHASRDTNAAESLNTLAAALACLLTLSVVMLTASLVATVPSPPHDKLPFVGTNLALSVVALVLLWGRSRAAAWVGALAALSYVPSVGLQKFATETHAVALAPVIVVGTALVVAALWSAFAALRRREAPTRAPDGHGLEGGRS
jgi:hypothetical protein